MNLEIPHEPVWRVIKGQNGMITYNAFWLQANALDWHFFVDSPEVTLNYLSIDEMPMVKPEVSNWEELSKEKHDGKLDDHDEAKVQYGAMYPGESGIYIGSAGDLVYLNLPQSLSLLKWLQQEKETLEQRAKG